MSPEQREIARHMLGLPNINRESYRNRYFASLGHPAWHALHEMVDIGWMNLEDTKNGRETRFWLTKAGALLALDPGERLDPEDFPP